MNQCMSGLLSSKQQAPGRQRLTSRLRQYRTHKKGMVICRHGMRQSATSLDSSSPLTYIEERRDHSGQTGGNAQCKVEAPRG